MSGHFREMRPSIITCSFYFYYEDFSCQNLCNVEPFFVFYTESVMLSPCFIPESVFYTQSVMLSPGFTPESVFYTQSVVRIPQAVFYTDRLITWFAKWY